MLPRALALLSALWIAVSPAWAASTVNPNVPVQGSSLTSAPIRANFAAANADINNILGGYAGISPPGNPVNMQTWVDTSGSPVYTFRYYNANTVTWVAYATLNITTNVYSPVGGGGGGGVNPGTVNQVAWYAAGGSTVSGLATIPNGTLVTSGGSVPSISTTLPSAVQSNITRTGTLLGGGTSTGFTVDLGNSTVAGVLGVANGGTGGATQSAAQTGLGLGSMATQSASAVSITGGAIAGLSPSLAVADGGTGAATAGGARTNLGLGTMATQAASAVAITGGTFTGLPNPVVGADAANKTYVDAVATGAPPLPITRLATTAALAANTYNNGTAGVGATLTANSNGTLSIDSVATNSLDTVLINNEGTLSHNGVYTVTQTGSVSTPYILTRISYFDQAAEMRLGSSMFISAGTVNAFTTWGLQAAVTTVGTDPVSFLQTASSAIGTNTVTLSQLAQALANTTLCNPTGSTANLQYCSKTQLTTQVNTFTSGLSGAVPASGAATSLQFLNGVGGFTTPPTGASSVGLVLPSSILTVTVSPITTSGNLTATLANQSANQFFAGPTSGSAATPGFRIQVHDDVPTYAHTETFVACDPTGVTDCSTPIQTAWSNCAAAWGGAGGGIVRVSGGTVNVNTGVSITSSGCGLIGSGIYSEFTGAFGSQTAPTAGTNFYQTSGSNCAITVSSGVFNFYIAKLGFVTSQPADTVGWTANTYKPFICGFAGPGYIEKINCWFVTTCIQIGALGSPVGRTVIKDVICGAATVACINGIFAADVTTIDHLECYPYLITGSHRLASIQLSQSCIFMNRLDGAFINNVFAFGGQIGIGAQTSTDGDAGDIKISNYRSESNRYGLYLAGCGQFQGSSWMISGIQQGGGAVANSIGIEIPGNSCTVTTHGGPTLDVVNLTMNWFANFCVAANPYDISLINVRCWNYNQANNGSVGMIANPGAVIGVAGRMAFDTASSNGAAATGGSGTFHTAPTY